jgi:hypothetical protein
MAASKLPQILDYLAATFTAAATLGGATPPVAVYDGPVLTQEPAQRVLWVGLDDPDADEPETASAETPWASLGAQAKTEQFQVWCAAEAWGGETDVAAIRTVAFGIYNAAEAVLRADVMLGGLAQFCGVAGVVLRQNQTTQGAVARVSFRIEGQARI